MYDFISNLSGYFLNLAFYGYRQPVLPTAMLMEVTFFKECCILLGSNTVHALRLDDRLSVFVALGIRIEIDVPQIGNADSDLLLKILQQFVAVATHLGAGGTTAAMQYNGRIAPISIGRRHLDHLHLLRIPVVAVKEAHYQSIHPAQCGDNCYGQQTMHHGQSA